MKSQSLPAAFCALPQPRSQEEACLKIFKSSFVVARVVWAFFVIMPATCRLLISDRCPVLLLETENRVYWRALSDTLSQEDQTSCVLISGGTHRNKVKD